MKNDLSDVNYVKYFNCENQRRDITNDKDLIIMSHWLSVLNLSQGRFHGESNVQTDDL